METHPDDPNRLLTIMGALFNKLPITMVAQFNKLPITMEAQFNKPQAITEARPKLKIKTLMGLLKQILWATKIPMDLPPLLLLETRTLMDHLWLPP